MPDRKNLFARNTSETAEYFCRLVREHSKVTRDLDYLMAAFCTMASAIEQLEGKRGCENIYDELVEKCIFIACYLLDLVTKACSKSNK